MLASLRPSLFCAAAIVEFSWHGEIYRDNGEQF
jgi:hypothetical protein